MRLACVSVSVIWWWGGGVDCVMGMQKGTGLASEKEKVVTDGTAWLDGLRGGGGVA